MLTVDGNLRNLGSMYFQLLRIHPFDLPIIFKPAESFRTLKKYILLSPRDFQSFSKKRVSEGKDY